MKMGKLGEEVSEKIKCAIRAKLTELGVHIDNELPDYVMVLVANKKSQKQMDEDLTLFLGESTTIFTTWLYDVLKKLEQYTISSKGMKRKIDDKKTKHKKIPSENEDTSFSKKVKLKSENLTPEKQLENYTFCEEISNSNEDFLSGKADEKGKVEPELPKIISYSDEEEEEEEEMILGEDDEAINLHDINEGISDKAESVSVLEEKSSDLLSSAIDKINGEGEEVKARERIKITWDNKDSEGRQQKEEFSSLNKYKNNYEDKEWENNNRKKHLNENGTKNSLRDSIDQRNNLIKSSGVHKECEHLGNKVTDARDILKKRSSHSSKTIRRDDKLDKHRRSRKPRDKGSKENITQRLSSVSKPVVRESDKPSVPSLVKVTPRPQRPPGLQPSCNLILKAVADAEKSIATTKLTQKKAQNEYMEKTQGTSKRTRRENISITLLNDRILSNDIEDASRKQGKIPEEYDPGETAVEVYSPLPISAPINTKEEPSSSSSSDNLNTPSFDESYCYVQEPRFIITLDNTASDTEIEGDVDISHENEKCIQDIVDETVTVVRQPFDKSRLGPRLGPPPVIEDLIETRDYRLYTNIDQTDSSQEVDMENADVNSENGKSQTRCKYWPCCDAGSSCSYYHPTMLCRLFPACHFGDKCLYIHPACKFADQCLNTNCPFTHTSATPVIGKGTFKATQTASASGTNIQVCMYYPNCTKPFCPFIHVKKPCKFGTSCTKLGCEYEHQIRNVNKNPYKWVANQ